MYFAMFSIIFPLICSLVGFFIVYTIVRSIREQNQNNHSPRLEVEAGVVAKRQSTSVSHMNNAAPMTDTSYFVTFEVRSGDRMEFRLPGREYGLIAEGDFGILTFQGTRYISFERR